VKAVIPAAGRGTRFLPFTKNAPKEMLPLVDKPAIQYVVEEAVASGCDDIVIITGRGKQVIEDHFDINPELETFLARTRHQHELEAIQDIAKLADIHYIRQKEPLGLGHAVYQARRHVGDEPFALLLGDDIVFSQTPCTKQLIEQQETVGGNIVAVEPITAEQTRSYGVVDPLPGEGRLRRVRDLVEKPAPEQAPSNLGILGRYVLEPSVFDAIARTPPGRNGEIQLTDALRLQVADPGVHSYEFEGKRYDLGNKVDWLQTNVEVALMRPEYRERLLAVLRAHEAQPLVVEVPPKATKAKPGRPRTKARARPARLPPEVEA